MSIRTPKAYARRLALSVALVLLVWAIARGQDVNSPTSNAPGGGAAGSAPASSQRYPVPAYADDPGTEGALSIGYDRLYSYHGGAWGWSPRFAMQNRPTTTTTPTP